MIRWLHISDLHLGNSDFSSSEMRDRLPEFIKKHLPIDYIFLTGDILTAGPDAVYTTQMALYIKLICDTCKLSSDRLFITPGNHDINRNSEGRHKVIRKLMYHRSGYYDPMKGDITKDDLTKIWKGQENFRNFLSLIYPDERLAYYQNPQMPHFVVETPDFNIIHLDTTVSYTKNQEANDLIVGTNLLYNALKDINKKKPSILITHYPMTSLLQDEKKILSNFLQKNGVRLWLAGHEHDHNLQKFKYLDMLQAGELRYEKGATASFLIGEFNPADFKAEVKAYMWFTEGWAQYPFLNLDATKKEIFSFLLKPADDEALPALTRKAREANEPFMFRLSSKLDRRIFPKIDSPWEVDNIGSLLDEAWTNGKNNVILLGEGGMGKSTMLLSFCKDSEKPVLYVSAEYLIALGLKLEEYCRDSLFNGNNEEFRSVLSESYSAQSLIVVIDGMNEVDADSEGSLIRQIQRMSMLKGVQFLIASRVDFTVRYNLPSFCKAHLIDLDDSVLSNFFSEQEWKSIEESANLKKLVRNPMLATIYKEVCSVIDKYRDVEFLDWTLPIENSTDLFYNFYLAQIALMMSREGLDKRKLMVAMVCVNQILPAIAFDFETSFNINKLNKDFRDILAQIVKTLTVDEQRLEAVRIHYRWWEDLRINFGDAYDVILNELHLLHSDGMTTSFSHQMYRDYLSARHIINESAKEENILSFWNNRELPVSIGKHIQYASGEYWNGLALSVKKIAMQVENPEIMITNIFRCFPSLPNKGTADFSGLQLNNMLLPSLLVMDSKVPLKDSSIDFVTLGLGDSAPKLYRVLAFSPDKRFLAAAADKNLEIFDLRQNKQIFTYRIGKIATQMMFVSNRLFINAGVIIVFSFDGEWSYVGEVKIEGGAIFKKDFRTSRVKDDCLFLYYDYNRYQYNLKDGSLSKFLYGAFDANHVVDGECLDNLRRSIDVTRHADGDKPLATAKVGDLCASSYADGRIEVAQDGEVILQYGNRVSVLKDAAISGDGNTIATLSSEIFNGKRRLQIWDVKNKIKSAELFCDFSIQKINLSYDGGWILGSKANNETWIFSRRKGEGYLTDEVFVSNQKGKIITLGDYILRKNAEGRLELRNLETNVVQQIKCPYPNPSIVCALKNNTIGAVDHRGSSFRFASDRGGKMLTISHPGEIIQALEALNGHPFIAVAATNGVVSVYHSGTGQRTRILGEGYQHTKLTACHPTKTIFAHSDGRKKLTIEYFHTWDNQGKENGRWMSMHYKHNLESRILDMDFNEVRGCLIVVLSNGKILYLSENWCKLQETSHIITSFDTDAYDFRGVKCSPKIIDILRQNSCLCC